MFQKNSNEAQIRIKFSSSRPLMKKFKILGVEGGVRAGADGQDGEGGGGGGAGAVLRAGQDQQQIRAGVRGRVSRY